MGISADQIERALALIGRGSANADYFFQRLESTAWIKPLADEGLFAVPYQAVQQGDAWIFPVWTPGEYLARMAGHEEAQGLVTAILSAIPKSDNPRVYEAIADAAARVSLGNTIKLIPQLERGLALPYQLLLPDKIAEVIVRLSEAEYGQEALRLAEVLFAVLPANTQANGRVDLYLGSAKGRVDAWQYGELLGKVVFPLTRTTTSAAVQLFSDLLGQAIAATEKHETNDDYSYIWRPSIAEPEHHRENIRDNLVDAVRDASVQVTRSDPTVFPLIRDILLSADKPIFKRIVLYVATESEGVSVSDVSLLDEPARWDDINLHPEFELFLAKRFGELSPRLRQEYVAWIHAGPDVTDYTSFRTQMDGHAPGDEEVRLHQQVWIRDHLNVIREHLSADDSGLLEELLRAGPPREVGRPFHRITVGWRGETSPLSEEETTSISWKSFAAKLLEWRPPSDGSFDSPTIEGLANSLRSRITEDHVQAAQHLRQLVGIDPRYISAILESLRDVVRNKHAVAWAEIIVFVNEAGQRAHNATDLVDKWRWVSKCAASLVGEGLQQDGKPSIPFDLRPEVWSALQLFAANPDPTPQHESRYGGSNMDPTTLSLNTVRGEALHGAVRYGLWCRKSIKLREREVFSFALAPELHTLLDEHLEHDTSLAVRAVYGQWFPWLSLLDMEWASSRATVVFPTDDIKRPYFQAAWGSYVVYCRPYTDVLPVLRFAYAEAIRQMAAGVQLEVGFGERVWDHLGDHLMIYFWRQELELTDTLIKAFFDAATPDHRGHAIETVGRVLGNVDTIVPDELAGRLRRLWEWRISQQELTPEELQSFGWWVLSDNIAAEFAIDILDKVTSKRVLPEPDTLVVKKMALLASAHPVAMVTILDRIVDLASNSWAIYGWRDSAMTILSAGLKPSESKALTERLVHRLVALRHQEFRSLLGS